MDRAPSVSSDALVPHVSPAHFCNGSFTCLPAGHVEHVDALPCEKKPAEQERHVPSGGVEPLVPGGHGVHEPELALEKVPTGHVMHSDPPVLLYFPAAQLVQVNEALDDA